LGGVTRVVVLDNLREGVITPDIHDAALNPLYRDVLKHYGAVALPCRVQDPDRKGKVESGVGHAQKTPLKGLRFESLNVSALCSLPTVRSRTGASCSAMSPRSAPCSTVCCIMATCSSAVRADWRTTTAPVS
jgi:hypothetical protein